LFAGGVPSELPALLEHVVGVFTVLSRSSFESRDLLERDPDVGILSM
jgi:hypothetical protein